MAAVYMKTKAGCLSSQRDKSSVIKGIPMIYSEDRKVIVARIHEIEATVVSRDGKGVSIREIGEAAVDESMRLSTSSDALMPVLRTALVINWREAAMKPRYDRFRMTFPEISTLASLKKVLDEVEPVEFCSKYLNINARSTKNPKYGLLLGLTNGFLEYQQSVGLASEIEAIRHWAAQVDLKKNKSDPIGKIHGVGPGVVENIRLNLGLPVVKPDRHVIGVMEKFLQVAIPRSSYGEFAESVGMHKRYFDSIAFEYGKEKQISA